jgi:hypothetical protein
MHKLLPALGLAFLFSIAVHAQCGPGESAVRLEIDPDSYWYEVSWKLTSLDGTVLHAEGEPAGAAPQVFNYCVPADACVRFTILDEYGDAMAPDGRYRLFADSVLIQEYDGYNYGFSESVTFNCPPGAFCSNPLPIDTGFHVTPDISDGWYSFIPADTGTYHLSTCDFGIGCATKLWVYDRCQNILVSDNYLGAIFYADEGCDTDPSGAKATLYLAGGKEYFLRIGYDRQVFCLDTILLTPIPFSLLYAGPVVGCTDSIACNYQPLATVSDTCIYPGDPECLDLPDLIVLEDVLRNSLEPDMLSNADPCTVEEGCLRGFGDRFILRFTSHIKNKGLADYFIGETPSDPDTPSDQFVYDPCHLHWHYRGYAEYVLFNPDGVMIPIGAKNGFCVFDLECQDGGVGKFNCSNMGISAGCGDIYEAALPCQWVDLTDIPAGQYTLVVRVNWDKSPDKTGRHESNYLNNWAQACFELRYDALGNPSIETLNDCPQFTDCNGEVFGSAQPDCNGVCNGSALHGDWNLDTLRNDADITAYLQAANQDAPASGPCTDLHVNDTIDVYDAAILQECVLHADEPQYWGARFACQFPGGIANPAITYLLPGALDTTAKTFDVRIMNPSNFVLGFEFSVSGLQISSVENLRPEFSADWHVNPATGEILALTAEELPVGKNLLPSALLRINYSALTAPEVCISKITAIVNESYQLCAGQISNIPCVSTGVTAADDISNEDIQAVAVPNPARDYCTLYFSNSRQEPLRIYLQDAMGRTCRQFEGIRGQSVLLERRHLPAGVYFYVIEGDRGRVTGKLIWK